MRAITISLLIGAILLQCSTKGPEVILYTSDDEIHIQVELADSQDKRRRGLMGRESLGSREGMLFIFPSLSLNPFWMENTPISLDILFISDELTIDKIAAETTPYSRELIRPARPYLYVLEIRGGTAADIGLQPGDRITLPRLLEK